MSETIVLNPVALAVTYKNLKHTQTQVNSALQLLVVEKATVPFVSRYRKEATGGLDDVALIEIMDSYNGSIEQENRRSFILESIKKQEKLTPDLEKKILQAQNLNQLEDLYAPYKNKQKTKAQKAIEQGLAPLAELLKSSKESLEKLEELHAKSFINKEKKIEDFTQAVSGASDIIIEEISHNGDLKTTFRELFWKDAKIVSSTRKNFEKIEDHLKYKDYFEFEQKISDIKNPKNSYRYLALRRGMLEKILKVDIEFDKEYANTIIRKELFPNIDTLGCKEIIEKCISRAFSIYIHTSLSLEIKNELKLNSDESAIKVFGENLKNLLLQPYLGQKAILGIDPGVRSGCKVVAIDKNGNYNFDTIIYPHPPRNDHSGSARAIEACLVKFDIKYIAIGNGTFGRETLDFIQKNIPAVKTGKVKAVLVNEDGASIYSASAIAREEFPDKDVTVRGAVSIARRFQDPLGELVKIDPKSIGVGQYQHDVNPVKLKKSLEHVVEGCVNHVGVDLNTASAPLLSFISGVGPGLAKNIVKAREKSGGFKTRKELLKVARFTEKTFEQSAGFLRIYGGENPLDATFIHPEAYPILERWCKEKKISLKDLPQNKESISSLEKDKTLKAKIGDFTFDDIVKCLKSPSQDPRTEFTPFNFREGVETISDLREGLYYPGLVTNITQFGAFVDIGIKENGLIHISQMSDTFVEDPLSVLKVGQEVKTRVMEVDVARKRIALSLKSEASGTKVKGTNKFHGSSNNRSRNNNTGSRNQSRGDDKVVNNPFGALKGLKL
ncbi:MAG: helix-hairpin-helix domain-containing protein [Bdellovibrionales bacterium]